MGRTYIARRGNEIEDLDYWITAMKPKKKKGKKPNLAMASCSAFQKLSAEEALQKANAWKQTDVLRMSLAGEAFMDAMHRSGIQLDQIPPHMIRGAMVSLYDGVPLVFTRRKNNQFIICDPGTYARMVGK